MIIMLAFVVKRKENHHKEIMYFSMPVNKMNVKKTKL